MEEKQVTIKKDLLSRLKQEQEYWLRMYVVAKSRIIAIDATLKKYKTKKNDKNKK